VEGFRVKQRHRHKIPIGTPCAQCQAQHGHYVYKSKTRKGVWTCELDCVMDWPDEWDSTPRLVTLKASTLLCAYCSANPAKQAA